MKTKNLFPLLISTLFANSLYGASSIQLEVGEFQDQLGSTVIVGTWLLILDTNDNGILPGGLAASPISNGALLPASAIDIANDFSGYTLGLGEIEGDNVISFGSIGDVDLGDGFATALVSFLDGQEGLAYGIYWVPGLNPGDTLPTSGTFEMGGYFQSTTTAFAAYGMFAPPAPVSNSPAVFDVGSFNAVLVTAVPEPSTLALSALAALGLLRRRRA